MFVNYVDNHRLSSPINVSVTRGLLGSYLIWNVLSFNFVAIANWPIHYRTFFVSFVPPHPTIVLPAEQAILVFGLVCFSLGLYERYAATLSVLLLWHLTAILYMKSYVGRIDSLFIASYLVIFFGLYAAHDKLSLDEFRRTAEWELSELNAFLKASDQETYNGSVLKWSLLAVAFIYFGSGWAKIVWGPLDEWATAWSLGRMTVIVQARLAETAVGNIFLSQPILLKSAAIGTIALEVGFLLIVVLGFSITLAVIGLLAMHLLIAIGLGPFFFDQIVFLAMFFSWDRLCRWGLRDRPMLIVYDEECYFCARSLVLFKHLDIGGHVTFRTQSDAPKRLPTMNDVEFDDAMYGVRAGQRYRGYHAFAELFGHFPGLRWVAWLMRRRPLVDIGERVYRYIADNRTRYFACSAPSERSNPESGN